MNQMKVIAEIETQVKNNLIQFTTVPPVENFEEDPKMCLTSVHFPANELLEKIQKEIITPLKQQFPNCYYYSNSSLHLTLKNVRTVSEPPTFGPNEISKAKEVFSFVLARHLSFQVYFYRLLLFPHNLALIGTTDPELDKIILDLDHEMNKNDIADDKKYLNDRYFFCNMTLARFREIPEGFKERIEELSGQIKFEPYTFDNVNLITSNAVLKKLKVLQSWTLAKNF